MDNIKFLVCPHDTANNPDKWYHFAQYLTQKISNSVHFEQSMDFPDFHQQMESGGLIYANPQDSLKLINEHQYTPIVRSSNLFDEIVFVSNKTIQSPQISDLSAADIISVNSMLITRVGIKFLLDQDIKPTSIKPASSWMAVVKSISRCEEKFGFLYKDFYDGLNTLSKSGLVKIAETHDGTIHHNLLVSPALKAVSSQLQQYLTEMHTKDERTKLILNSLNMDKFITVSKEDILAFENLTELGNDLMENKEAATA